ncbi:MAG: AI-2E family transporter [Kiritimatiellae bacterium]|nr:AI-2E family transporter [Kiritimatiellia bacterium]
MAEKQKYSFVSLLVGTAAFFIAVAGIKVASSFLVPLLLAVFIAALTTPLLFWLRKFKVPTWLAILILMVGLIVISTVGATTLLKSINSLAGNLPQYQAQLSEKLVTPLAFLEEKGFGSLNDIISKALTGKNVWSIAGNTIGAVSGILSNTFVVLLVVLFFLSEAAIFPQKLRAMPGMTQKSLDNITEAITSIRRYMGLKALTSLITAVCVFVLAKAFKLDIPIILAVLAFLLNFIPNVGSIMAAIPGIILALITYGGGAAFGVGVGYLAINVLIGNILEPRIMGDSLGLSPLVVVLSLLLWGWVLGPVGMLLSVPLTTTAKLFMANIDETRGIAILMSDAPPKKSQLELKDKAK